MNNIIETMEKLKKYNFKIIDYCEAKSEKEIISFFKKHKGNVVLKGFKKGITHKTDAGLVRTELKTEEELIKAFRELKKKKCEKIIVQKKIKGLELFFGGKNEKDFGKIVIFGIGGIYVELYKDVSMRFIPVDEKEARRMIEEIKGKRYFEGFRGMPKIKKEMLAKQISEFSKFLGTLEFLELDLNPVFWDGKDFVVVDIRIK